MRAFAFWASCSYADPAVEILIKQSNVGCVQEKETIRPSTIREFNALTTEDYVAFNKWLAGEERVTYAGVKAKLEALRHGRWARWHVMASDNPRVDDSCSMHLAFLHLCLVAPSP